MMPTNILQTLPAAEDALDRHNPRLGYDDQGAPMLPFADMALILTVALTAFIVLVAAQSFS